MTFTEGEGPSLTPVTTRRLWWRIRDAWAKYFEPVYEALRLIAARSGSQRHDAARLCRRALDLGDLSGGRRRWRRTEGGEAVGLSRSGGFWIPSGYLGRMCCLPSDPAARCGRGCSADLRQLGKRTCRAGLVRSGGDSADQENRGRRARSAPKAKIIGFPRACDPGRL